MYVPDAYRARDPSWPLEVARSSPLAILLSNGPDSSQVPWATHVPVVWRPELPPDQPTDGALSGTSLVGHMNRANPHWRALRPGTPAVVVFHGPHGYVSPVTYQTCPAAPTWDFTAVHVHGTLFPVAEAAETMRILGFTAELFEREFGLSWDMTPSLGYFDRLRPAVGAFRMEVSNVDSMFKLSQEQQPEVRRRVMRAFADSDSGTHRQLARMIQCFAFGPDE